MNVENSEMNNESLDQNGNFERVRGPPEQFEKKILKELNDNRVFRAGSYMENHRKTVLWNLYLDLLFCKQSLHMKPSKPDDYQDEHDDLEEEKNPKSTLTKKMKFRIQRRSLIRQAKVKLGLNVMKHERPINCSKNENEIHRRVLRRQRRQPTENLDALLANIQLNR